METVGRRVEGPMALRALREQVARDLSMIEVPARDWLAPTRAADGTVIDDVVIVGAGLSGLTIAFGLMRKGLARVRILDAAPAGAEGPWLTTARMRTLRSPKTLSGLDYGLPALTYRAWHEAVYGADHFAAMSLIDRRDWMAYLSWFREVLAIPVENDTALTGIRHASAGEGTGHLMLQTTSAGGVTWRACRKLVLATGIGGAGGPLIPPMVADALGPDAYVHSDQPFDCALLEAERVAVLGAAASAFDFAVAALGHGAHSVHLISRAAALPVTEVLDWSNFPGFLEHFGELSDPWRLAFTHRMLAFRNPPTQEMYDRATGDGRFCLHAGQALAGIARRGDTIALTLSGGDEIVADRLLLGTGYAVDLSHRPELAALAPHIALWRDRVDPPEEFSASPVLDYPYLGPSFELLEKEAGTAPALQHIHLFNNGAVPSLGPICNGVTGLKYGAPRIVAGLTRALFMEDIHMHYEALDHFDKRHFCPRTMAAEA